MFLIALFDGSWLWWFIFGPDLAACFLDVAYIRPLRDANWSNEKPTGPRKDNPLGSGTPSLFALEALGGWKTPEIVKQYAQMDGSNLVQRANHVTFTAQQEHPANVPEEELAVNA